MKPLATLRALWSSTGFRLAGYMGVLVTITLAASLAILYLQTVGVLQQRIVRTVSSKVQQLQDTLRQGGYEKLIADIAAEVRQDSHANDTLLLLLDPAGKPLAGNIAPPTKTLPFGSSQRQVVRDGEIVQGHLQIQELFDGGVLIVGRDLRDQEAIESLVRNAGVAAIGMALMLIIGGTFVFRQELDRSVGTIRITAARIAAGNLQERVALSGQDDEFDLLKRDLNDMLDRIQSLMDGVRHVSDTIAHDLRTPLTRVLLRLRQAGQSHDTPAQLQAHMEAATHDLEELASTFEKLLQIAEAESGTQRMPFQYVQLDTVAADVCELYDAVAEERGIALQCHPDGQAAVLADRNLLAGAIANLVDNALKYAGPGALVQVRTERTPDAAVLTVQDNGAGVAPSALAQLDQRFVRLDPTAQSGYGLGLASVRATLTLHGGTLTFSDASPGLRAQFSLPLHPED